MNDNNFLFGFELECLHYFERMYRVRPILPRNIADDYDSSIDILRKNRLQKNNSLRFLRDEKEYRTGKPVKRPQLIDQFNDLIDAINEVKTERNNFIVNQSTGLHIHFSLQGDFAFRFSKIENNISLFNKYLIEYFVKHNFNKTRRPYCARNDGSRYSSARHVGVYHFEVRVFNGTFSKEAFKRHVDSIIKITEEFLSLHENK